MFVYVLLCCHIIMTCDELCQFVFSISVIAMVFEILMLRCLKDTSRHLGLILDVKARL